MCKGQTGSPVASERAANKRFVISIKNVELFINYIQMLQENC
jgi:hypothetical protein